MKRQKSAITIAVLLVTMSVILTACGDAPITPMATAPAAPTDTPTPSFNLSAPNLERGHQVYIDKQCVACHGKVGQGGIGPVLADSSLPFDRFVHALRTAIAPKPKYNTAELPDQDAYNVYAWLESLARADVALQPPVAPNLAKGEVLGMTLWTSYECDQCHGTFAQGSTTAPTLAHVSYPYEMERAKMRQTEDKIPQHTTEHIRDVVLKRLYKWLQEGAKPLGGC